MGVTTFSLFRIASSLETADETRSVFSGYVLGNPALLKGPGLSIVTIVLATELGILKNVLGMTSLTGQQWARLHRRGPVADRRRGSQEGAQDPHGRGAGPDAGAGRGLVVGDRRTCSSGLPAASDVTSNDGGLEC